MAKNQHVIRGTLDWAKIVGPPKLNDHSGQNEWSFDLTPNPAGMELLKKEKLTEKLRQPKESDRRKEYFLTLRQRESRTDPKTGEIRKNRPIEIEDAAGNPWPEGKLIGNGSIADVMISVGDRSAGRKWGLYPDKVRILQLVAYDSPAFAPLSEDDEFFGAEPVVANASQAAAATQNPDDLDDDIPF